MAKVLLVEDQEDNRDMLSRRLREPTEDIAEDGGELGRRKRLRQLAGSAHVRHHGDGRALLRPQLERTGSFGHLDQQIVRDVAPQRLADERASELELMREPGQLARSPVHLELGARPSDHHGKVERLRHVVVGASRETLDHVIGGLECSGQDHRELGTGPLASQALQHLETVHAGQKHLQHHQIGMARVDAPQRLDPVARRLHCEAVALETPAPAARAGRHRRRRRGSAPLRRSPSRGPPDLVSSGAGEAGASSSGSGGAPGSSLLRSFPSTRSSRRWAAWRIRWRSGARSS